MITMVISSFLVIRGIVGCVAPEKNILSGVSLIQFWLWGNCALSTEKLLAIQMT
jgi:hypothetical protein